MTVLELHKTRTMHSEFVERESHKHRLSKELLASWFKEQEKTEDYCKVAQFKWRSNYGVFTELKFYETSVSPR